MIARKCLHALRSAKAYDLAQTLTMLACPHHNLNYALTVSSLVGEKKNGDLSLRPADRSASEVDRNGRTVSNDISMRSCPISADGRLTTGKHRTAEVLQSRINARCLGKRCPGTHGSIDGPAGAAWDIFPRSLTEGTCCSRFHGSRRS